MGIHKKCTDHIVRGIKVIKCTMCNQEGFNNANGASICSDCCEKANLCRICGKPISDKEINT